jgi:cytochrome c biogenesis protein CcmG/thiol:disulfide interchange protein DsbE
LNMLLKFIPFSLCIWVLSFQSIIAQPVNASNSVGTHQQSDSAKKEYPYQIELKDSLGQIHYFSELVNKDSKATVLLFWVTTCLPCRMELDAISDKFNKWKKLVDFNFYAISMDNPDREEKFNTRVKISHWTYPAYFDYKWGFKSVMDGGLVGLPQIFVLDKNGQVIYHTKKYQSGDEDKLFELIQGI